MRFLFVLLAFSFVNNAVAQNAPQKRHLVIVNRQLTSGEQALSEKGVVNVISANDKQIAEANYKDFPLKQRALDELRRLVEKLELTGKPYTIEWFENAQGGLIGDVSLTVGEKEYVVLSAPGGMRQNPPAPTSQELDDSARLDLKVLTQKTATSSPADLARDFVVWSLDAPSAKLTVAGQTSLTFTDAEVQRLYAASGLAQADDQVIEHIALSLGRVRRAKVFTSQHALLGPIYQRVRAYLLANKRVVLMWDFAVLLKEVEAAKDSLKFVGERHAHDVVGQDPDRIRLKLAYLHGILLGFKPGDFSAHLPRKLRDWATLDTNTDDEATRKQPIDILTYSMSASRFKEMATRTNYESVARNKLVVASIQSRITPERYQPKIFVNRSSDARIAQERDVEYYIYCAGAEIRIDQQFGLTPANGPLVSTLTITDAQIRQIRQRRQNVVFFCGQIQHTLTAPVEMLKLPLPDPGGAKFTVGADKLLKAVTTFPVVSAASNTLIDRMKVGLALTGFKQVGQDQNVQDLRKDFFQEMRDTDFYFPAYHGTSSEQFQIGHEGARKILLRKQDKGITFDMILYTPPLSGGALKNGAQNVIVTDKEIAQVFEARRTLPVLRRLHVLNISCGSKECVPHWMRAYKFSVKTLKKKYVGSLGNEVPIIIGANKSFRTGSVGALQAHAVYPLQAMMHAGQETAVVDFIRWLSGNTDFNPETNIGKPVFFEVQAAKDLINIKIQSSAGGPALVYVGVGKP